LRKLYGSPGLPGERKFGVGDCGSFKFFLLGVLAGLLLGDILGVDGRTEGELHVDEEGMV